MKVKTVHWEIIVDFMLADKDFATGRINGNIDRERYNKLWSQLTATLNSAGCGEKSVKKWQKSWTDFKCSLKRKAGEIKRTQETIGDGPPTEKMLSRIESKVLMHLGDVLFKDCNVQDNTYLEDVNDDTYAYKRENPFIHDALEDVKDFSVDDHDYLHEDVSSHSSPPPKKKAKTDAESNDVLTELKQIHGSLSSQMTNLNGSVKELTGAINNFAAVTSTKLENLTAAVNNSTITTNATIERLLMTMNSVVENSLNLSKK